MPTTRNSTSKEVDGTSAALSRPVMDDSKARQVSRLAIQQEKLRKAILWGQQEKEKRVQSTIESLGKKESSIAKKIGVIINNGQPPRRLLALRNKSTAATIAAAARMKGGTTTTSTARKNNTTTAVYSKPNKIVKASPGRVKKQSLPMMTAIGHATKTAMQRRQSLRLKARRHKLMTMGRGRGNNASSSMMLDESIEEEDDDEKTLFADPTVPPFASHEKLTNKTSASTPKTRALLQQQQQDKPHIAPKHLFGSPAPVQQQQQQQQQNSQQRHGYTSSAATVAVFPLQMKPEDTRSFLTKNIFHDAKPAAPSVTEEKKRERVAAKKREPITTSKAVVTPVAGTTRATKKYHGILPVQSTTMPLPDPTSSLSMTEGNYAAMSSKQSTVLLSAKKEEKQAAIPDTTSSMESTNMQSTPPKLLTKTMPSISASPSIGALESHTSSTATSSLSKTTTPTTMEEKFEQDDDWPKLTAISEDQDEDEEFDDGERVQHESLIKQDEIPSMQGKTSPYLKWAGSCIVVILAILFSAGFSKQSHPADGRSRYEEIPSTATNTNQMLDARIGMELVGVVNVIAEHKLVSVHSYGAAGRVVIRQ